MNCEKYDGWYPDYRSIVVVKPIKGVDYWTDEDKKEIVDQLEKSIPEIDGTLKIKGAAADAAVVGEKFTEVSGEIAGLEGLFDITESETPAELHDVMGDSSIFTAGKFCSHISGNISDNANYYCTEDFIPFPAGARLFGYYSLSATNQAYPVVVFYDADKAFIGGQTGGELTDRIEFEGMVGCFYSVPENTRYIRMSLPKMYLEDTERFTYLHVYIVTETHLQQSVKIPGLFVPELGQLTKNPFVGKTIVNLGDSIFGNSRPPNDVSTIISNLTGATVHNCAFGGCRMAQHIGHYDAFSMYRLADAIATGDWTLQDEALSYDDRTSYAEVPLALLKSMNYDDVDIITINYCTNDWNGMNPIDGSGEFDTSTYLGALRYSVKKIHEKYPHIKIVILSATWRFFMDADHNYTGDSDSTLRNDLTLIQYIEKQKEETEKLHLQYIDLYNIGINKYNRGYFFPANDGTHQNENGRMRIAEKIVKELC